LEIEFMCAVFEGWTSPKDFKTLSSKIEPRAKCQLYHFKFKNWTLSLKVEPKDRIESEVKNLNLKFKIWTWSSKMNTKIQKFNFQTSKSNHAQIIPSTEASSSSIHLEEFPKLFLD